jgi:hypothetical protein
MKGEISDGVSQNKVIIYQTKEKFNHNPMGSLRKSVTGVTKIKKAR